MIYFTQEGYKCIENLLYYPYTFGKHLPKAINDITNILLSLNTLPKSTKTYKYVIKGIGTIFYLFDSKDFLIKHISWSSVLTKFYYVKSNFITITTAPNITSTHPVYYKERTEDTFKCDNGYKVVSRTAGKRELFNFKNTDGIIISDIDFMQVKPFSKYRDMTARGFTPDRRCYMIFDDGDREEINESLENKQSLNSQRLYESIIRDVAKIVKQRLNEYSNKE